MRFVIACLFALGLLTSGVVTVPASFGEAGYVVALAQDVPTGELNVDIDTDDGAWYANPVWIAIGVIALVVLIAIVAMAARGGGTTVIKE